MVSLKSVLTLGLIGGAAAAPKPFPGKQPGGLPAYHPLVTGQGFDPAVVDASLRADAAHIIEAGYNLRVVLMGPEQELSVLAGEIQGVKWDGTGVGYGVRGTRLQDLTVRFEDIIQMYRDRVPKSPIMFNYSPDSALWAIQRHFPLSSNCTNAPGKDLGFNVFCDICSQ